MKPYMKIKESSKSCKKFLHFNKFQNNSAYINIVSLVKSCGLEPIGCRVLLKTLLVRRGLTCAQ